MAKKRLGVVQLRIDGGEEPVEADVVEQFPSGAILARYDGLRWLIHPNGESKQIGRSKADREGLAILRSIQPRQLVVSVASYESALATGILQL